MTNRRALTIPALLAASALCVATVVVREHHTGSDFYRFLVWNLVLAWVPFVLALAAYASARRGASAASVAFGVLWLLFFPNAPYLLTDFIHLQESPTTPLWYDALMLASFAWTGLVLGYASLYLMQMIWERAVGTVCRGSVWSRRSRSRASACTSAASCASTAGTRSCARGGSRT